MTSIHRTPSERKETEQQDHCQQPHNRSRRGQSLIEMALIVPILLIMVVGLVEVAAFMGAYLDALDLVREAARFASLRDPFYIGPTDMNCSTDAFNFYYDTVCIFSPPAGNPLCTGPTDPFCNGVNNATEFDMTIDDVVITVFTVVDDHVSAVAPSPPGYYAYSDHDSDTVNNGNWQKNCDGDIVRFTPYFTADKMNSYLSNTAPPKRGFVVVEYYYCYEQMLKAPLISTFVPEKMRIHVYTVMSLPAAIPTSTPFFTPEP